MHWGSKHTCTSCRCVVVIGMPYPNPSDPELRERMAYLDVRAAESRAAGNGAGLTGNTAFVYV